MPDNERYEFAEPDGGCFIPRHGDFARSMALLSTAAAWYNGAKAVPGDWKPQVRIVAKWTPETLETMKRAAQEYKRRGNPGLTGEDHA